MDAMDTVIKGGDPAKMKEIEILRTNFEKALSNVKPRVSPETVAFYEKYIAESGMRVI